jgi:indole-3-glycerol phosphate synthase
MPASLDSIVAATRQRLSQRRSGLTSAHISGSRRDSGLGALEAAAAGHTPRGFRTELRRVARDRNAVAVIAELKKASPSKGLIRADFKPSELARDLEQAGAAALSVLTDEEFFQGSLDYLRQASSNSSLPCLRKDFIVDEFQIVEARANHADAVLLIVAALDQKELVALAGIARSYSLDVLCEAHDEQELQRALDAGCDLIGINSRNLRTFEVNLETAFRLAEKIPATCVRVAESGIRSGADIARLRSAGYDAFLVGEWLMKAERPGEALANLKEEARLADCGETNSGAGSAASAAKAALKTMPLPQR